MNDFVQNETVSWFYSINWNLNQILIILKLNNGYFVIIVSKKNIAKIKLPFMNAASFFQGQRRLWSYQSILIIPGYLEHHCII